MVLDAKTGEPLWNVNIAQTSQGSPMTFMVGGKQYIALAGTSSITAYVLVFLSFRLPSSVVVSGCRRADMS